MTVSTTTMQNFYCLICKRIVGEGLSMPRGSDYAGQAVCVRCACEHFDKAIQNARSNHRADVGRMVAGED
jgi:hypothetical protein